MRFAYKVGLAGTHSTGKSTFLDGLETGLRARGVRVGRVGDLASEAQQKGFPILREHTFASTAWIMSRGMTLELEAARENQVVLVDRPMPDAYGYLEAALAHRNEQLDGHERTYLDALVNLHACTYDRLLVTRIEKTVPIDESKPRDLDPVFREMAEVGIDKIVERCSLSAQALPSDPSARQAFRDNLLEEIVRAVSSVSEIRRASAEG